MKHMFKFMEGGSSFASPTSAVSDPMVGLVSKLDPPYSWNNWQ